MKTAFSKYFLAAALAALAGTTTAQELNSAYFTDDFKYRHDMNAAYGNDQGYAAIPVLGNLNTRLQGNLNAGSLLFANPDFGRVAGAKKTATFLHPSISASEALSGLDKDGNTLLMDMDIPIASVGFNAFNGYNTVELRARTHMGLSMPYEFFEFAKNMDNKSYSFDDLGAQAWGYMELGFGHSRQIFDNLRVGAKVKLLFGGAYANLNMDGVQANLTDKNKWVISGKARMELNMKGAEITEKDEEYKARPGTYKTMDKVEVNSPGLGGFGLGLDLGGIYEFKDCSVDWLDGLKVSLALNDLGFISWSNTVVAESTGEPFEFNGFSMGYKDKDGERKFDNGMDEVADDFKDFANLRSKGDEGGQSHGLGATMRFGLEYPLPVYDRLTFGSLLTHRFDGKYSWTEERISANVKPLDWVDGGINVAFTSFCTTMGWVINFHPVGMNVFFGMDHTIGKMGASMVPLNSNVSFNFGLNVAWGGKKKETRSDLDRALTF